MLAIQGAAATTGNNLTAGRVYIFPADRCTWQYVEATDGSGYKVVNVLFHFGASTTASLVVNNPRLGFIGKSGRFVATSVPASTPAPDPNA